jgi:4-amino-4-deoxy-L-arabinose transferase-like glycosyltransferase
MHKSHWTIFCTLALVYFISRIILVFIIPISEAPDEGAHYWVIHFIDTCFRLPEYSDLLKDPAASYYGALSPFGYLMHIILNWVLPFDNVLLVSRIASVLIGLFTVWAALALAIEIFPQKKIYQIALPLIVILHPQLAFVQSYTNNDSMACTIASLVIVIMVRIIKYGFSTRCSFILGILLGILLLGKYSAFSLLPALALGFILALWANSTTLTQFIKAAAISFVTALSLSMWWFIHNYYLFEGDISGLGTMMKLHRMAYVEPPALYKWPIVDNALWRHTVFISFWALFGNMNRLLPAWMYKPYALFPIISFMGYLSAFFKHKLNKLFNKDYQHSFAIWIFILACAILSFVGLVLASASLNATGSPQGRYLFVGELAFMALLLKGFELLGNRLGKVMVIICIICFAGLFSYMEFMLYNIYGFSLNPMR